MLCPSIDSLPLNRTEAGSGASVVPAMVRDIIRRVNVQPSTATARRIMKAVRARFAGRAVIIITNRVPLVVEKGM